MEYQIQKLTPKYKHSLAELLDQTIGIQSNQKEQIINWKYSKEGVISFIALEQDRVIAHYANIPLNLLYNNKVFESMLCTDMAVHPSHRRKGLITALSAKVYEEVSQDNWCSIGFSNEEGIKVDKFSRNYKYDIVGNFSLYIKVLIKSPKTPIHLRTITAFNTPITQINNYICLKKSLEFMKWRYHDKPDNTYNLYEIYREQKFLGYVVLKTSPYFCYVYDIITAEINDALYKEILYAIEVESIRKNRRIVIINILENRFWKNIFEQTNYFKNKAFSKTTYLTVRIHKAFYQNELLDKEKWLLLNGDIL